MKQQHAETLSILFFRILYFSFFLSHLFFVSLPSFLRQSIAKKNLRMRMMTMSKKTTAAMTATATTLGRIATTRTSMPTTKRRSLNNNDEADDDAKSILSYVTVVASRLATVLIQIGRSLSTIDIAKIKAITMLIFRQLDFTGNSLSSFSHTFVLKCVWPFEAIPIANKCASIKKCSRLLQFIQFLAQTTFLLLVLSDAQSTHKHTYQHTRKLVRSKTGKTLVRKQRIATNLDDDKNEKKAMDGWIDRSERTSDRSMD